MKEVVGTAQQRGHLLPNTALKERHTHRPVPKVRAVGEAVCLHWHQDLVLMLAVHPCYCLNQAPAIATQPDVEILQMPSGDNNLHGQAGTCEPISPSGRCSSTVFRQKTQ